MKEIQTPKDSWIIAINQQYQKTLSIMIILMIIVIYSILIDTSKTNLAYWKCLLSGMSILFALQFFYLSASRIK